MPKEKLFKLEDTMQAAHMIAAFIDELQKVTATTTGISNLIALGEIAKAKKVADIMAKGIELHVEQIIEFYSTAITEEEANRMDLQPVSRWQSGGTV